MLWLDAMPDGTFPNVNLQEKVLTCLDSMNVNADNL